MWKSWMDYYHQWSSTPKPKWKSHEHEKARKSGNSSDDLVENDEWVLVKKPESRVTKNKKRDALHQINLDTDLQIYDADDENARDEKDCKVQTNKVNPSGNTKRKKSKIKVHVDEDEEEDDERRKSLIALNDHFSRTLSTSKSFRKTQLSRSNENLSSKVKQNDSCSDDQQDQHSDFEPYRGPFLNLLDDTPFGRKGKVLSNASSQPEIANIPSLEECWVVTPAPCFTGVPKECPKGSLEDLLIERTTKSVYQRLKAKSSKKNLNSSDSNYSVVEDEMNDEIAFTLPNEGDDHERETELKNRMEEVANKSVLNMLVSHFSRVECESNNEDRGTEDDNDVNYRNDNTGVRYFNIKHRRYHDNFRGIRKGVKRDSCIQI
ncbi:hypothetical protein HELRODRAFT_170038 [Helobdella robusta]|uniref:Uncharacterized protein n=1 Tax=Helobdella robusta TaxID=6412 RepID=T1F2K2_HELRO|nr:hypothetical protein HELRODRAFT_170038 [Helobdella robusta]ESO07501.1 hypothetical protein HELRODRAFT_170038 [Helobdella robusta]